MDFTLQVVGFFMVLRYMPPLFATKWGNNTSEVKLYNPGLSCPDPGYTQMIRKLFHSTVHHRWTQPMLTNHICLLFVSFLVHVWRNISRIFLDPTILGIKLANLPPSDNVSNMLLFNLTSQWLLLEIDEIYSCSSGTPMCFLPQRFFKK